MNRYFLGGLLSFLALVAASGSGFSKTLADWTIGQLPQNGTREAATVPPLEQAGQFVQRQAPVAVDQTLGRPASSSNNLPAIGNTLPGQPTTLGQAGGSLGSDPAATPGAPTSAPGTVPGTAPTNAQVNTPTSPATAATNQSLDAIPALW